MSRSHHVSASSESGFSLLEVIVALGILSVGIAAAVSLFTAGTAAHSRAVDRIKSIEISQAWSLYCTYMYISALHMAQL